MSYQCEQCKESSTVGDALNILIKVATFAAVAYVAFTYKDQIKETVKLALDKTNRNLQGPSKKSKKK